MYELSELNSSELDRDTLLFKLPRKERLSDATLSPLQIKAIYSLYNPSKPLTIIHHTEDHVFASTPDLVATQGVSIMSADLFLKIFNLQGFYVGVGESSASAKRNAALINREEGRELRKGQVLFLRPNYDVTSENLVTMGSIEITPAHKSLLFGRSYDNIRVKLYTIINAGFAVFPDFAVEFRDGIINIVNTNRNIYLYPGALVYLIGEAARLVTGSMNEEMRRIVMRIGGIST